MALVHVNGVPVQCEDSQWTPVRLGDVTRAFNGAPRDNARVEKKDFLFSTGLLELAESEATRGLVEGAGHLLNFEDASGFLYTSRQLAPASTTGAARSTTGARFGSACLTVASGAQLTWAVGVAGWEDGQGTFMAWVREGAGAWKHVVAPARTGAVYTNGALTAASGGYAFGRCQAGLLTLGDVNGQGVATAWDDVVALPYTVPAAWVPALYTWHAARAWPQLPFVVASGPRLPAAGLVVRGRVSTVRAMALGAGVGEVLDFTLYGT